MALTVDLNCDVGEGFGPYTLGNDEAIFDYITSANIACGFHAGDPHTMRRTVRLALDKRVAIGAHPGLPDRLGFGRRRWDLSPQDAFDLVVYQVGALWGFVQAEGAALRHVKPHGALYNMAAQDGSLAAAIAQAVWQIDRQLILIALAGSRLESAGLALGLRVGREAFADRTYEQDGSLTPRTHSSSVITNMEQVIHQALSIVERGQVNTRQGGQISLQADTICLHGDNPHAVEFARLLRTSLEAAGIDIAPLDRRA
jgi:UPF0271 protein